MIDLLDVYTCPIHGDVLADQVDRMEIVDAANDDVYVVYQHQHPCNHQVDSKLADTPQGKVSVLAKVDHERWLWWIGAYHYRQDF